MVYAAAQVLPGNPGQARARPRGDARGGGAVQRAAGLRPAPARPLRRLAERRGARRLRRQLHRRPTPSPTTSFPRCKRSGLLALYAFVLCVPLSILAGVIAAVRRGKPLDRTITVAGLSLAVIPEFVLGAILVAIFGPAFLNWFPGIAGVLDGLPLLTKLDSLFLPALALALVLFGYIARITRAGTIEALAADYTRTATLKGLSRRRVLTTHVVRNGLLPDDRRRRDPGRLPVRRDRRDREALRVPGGRPADAERRPGEELSDAARGGARDRRHLLRGDAARRPVDRRAQSADPARCRDGEREHPDDAGARRRTPGRAEPAPATPRQPDPRAARDAEADPSLEDVRPRGDRHGLLGRVRDLRRVDRAVRPDRRVVRHVQLRVTVLGSPARARPQRARRALADHRRCPQRDRGCARCDAARRRGSARCSGS